MSAANLFGHLRQLIIGPGILNLGFGSLARLDAIQWRQGNVDLTGFDHWPHVLVEERQQKNLDVGPIVVGISHDDDLVVIGVCDVELTADPCANRIDDRIKLFVFQDVIQLGLFRIENLTTQWQDRLKLSIAPLLGTPTG